MRPNSTIVVHCAIREDFFFPLLQLRNYVSASLVYCDYTTEVQKGHK